MAAVATAASVAAAAAAAAVIAAAGQQVQARLQVRAVPQKGWSLWHADCCIATVSVQGRRCTPAVQLRPATRVSVVGYEQLRLAVAAVLLQQARLHNCHACCPGVSLCCRQGPHRASPSLGCHHLHWPRSPGHAVPSDSLPSQSPCSRRTSRSCRQPQMPGVQNARPQTSLCGACAQRRRVLYWAAMETGGLLGCSHHSAGQPWPLKIAPFLLTPLAHFGQVIVGEASCAGLSWCCDQYMAG